MKISFTVGADFREAHGKGAGNGFGGGANLEEGIGVHRERVFDAGNAEAGCEFLIAVEHAKGDAGDLEALHPRLDLLAQAVK